ncbi:hypothetical protein ALQ93_200032 [Pseudomonas syringae pv. pisi]|uniref:Transposase component n=4 Tax=Pseudomonas syringae pv. pisi TaxID=59510 RepID=A0A3M3CBT5_PSESJ|nr:hypothetical protein ALQ93_200032 [Pseudomonas syringae pv. pisi]RMM22387.1 hypothetical protein ALQ82_200132 [Pseudomonas syringae pv. pisi]RMO21739.1 Transposase component [Pseudomonas syringae pv. pisi]RMV64773.1 Transposase component [Pseudomonas syringae pv. pisi]
MWAYATSQFSDLAAVVYDFSPSRAGEHARNFLKDWKGKLVCDDFGGYKASFELGVTEIGCIAHARLKFFELHATSKSQLAEQALRYIQLLYEIESEVRDLEPDLWRRIRQDKAVPVMDMVHAWMIAQRDLVPEGAAISRALDYSLKRWVALSRCRATSTTEPYPLTIIGPRIKSGHGLLDLRTGSLQGRYAAENGRRRS